MCYDRHRKFKTSIEPDHPQHDDLRHCIAEHGIRLSADGPGCKAFFDAVVTGSGKITINVRRNRSSHSCGDRRDGGEQASTPRMHGTTPHEAQRGPHSSTQTVVTSFVAYSVTPHESACENTSCQV